MSSKRKRVAIKAEKRVAHETEGGASGALVGVLLGVPAGPPGMIAGAVLGGVAGALAGAAMDSETAELDLRTRELDAVIGISGGDMGAPNLQHPPAKTGAYSAASAGVTTSGGVTPAEGPMPPPDEG